VGARTNADAPPAQQTEAPIEFAPSDVLTVAPMRLERGLPLTGTLTPLTEARVKARVSGELVLVAVREGEAVRRGQVLARIDQTEVEARVAARSADVEAARAQLVLAEKNRETQKALLDRNFISRNAFDATHSSYEVAEARLRAAEAELAMAQKSRGDAVLVAPFDGVIAERLARQGERVSVDAPIVTVVDLRRLELAAAVPASQIGRVRVGQPVEFQVEGLGARRFNGRIERINPATVAGTRSINVYAVIDNREAALRGGMFAQGRLLLDEIEQAIVIPASAVRAAAEGSIVYAIEGGIVRVKPVKVGSPDAEGRVQVLAGLDSGSTIVRSNLGVLRDGLEARVASGPTPAR
jgi:RND family efflux transporter MFP subunit